MGTTKLLDAPKKLNLKQGLVASSTGRLFSLVIPLYQLHLLLDAIVPEDVDGVLGEADPHASGVAVLGQAHHTVVRCGELHREEQGQERDRGHSKVSHSFEHLGL